MHSNLQAMLLFCRRHASQEKCQSDYIVPNYLIGKCERIRFILCLALFYSPSLCFSFYFSSSSLFFSSLIMHKTERKQSFKGSQELSVGVGRSLMLFGCVFG